MQPAGVLGMASLPSVTAFKLPLFSKEGVLMSWLSFALPLWLLFDGDEVLSWFLFLYAHFLGILLTVPLMDFVRSPLSAWFTVLLISWSGTFLEDFGTFLEDLPLAALYVMNRKKPRLTILYMQANYMYKHQTKFFIICNNIYVTNKIPWQPYIQKFIAAGSSFWTTWGKQSQQE